MKKWVKIVNPSIRFCIWKMCHGKNIDMDGKFHQQIWAFWMPLAWHLKYQLFAFCLKILNIRSDWGAVVAEQSRAAQHERCAVYIPCSTFFFSFSFLWIADCEVLETRLPIGHSEKQSNRTNSQKMKVNNFSLLTCLSFNSLWIVNCEVSRRVE